MVIINGKEEKAAGKTIAEYLVENGYNPERVVAEKNLEIIPKSAYGETLIEDGDSLEILNFVGGG
ncbi:MAG: sulfur carrier protein ThiS [Abditibacteriota bacterium]|nr:sulfur carrier protein ThiS [Abditibacteriota bacterium]